MKRGDVWWVTFDPAVGSEVCKTRPAVIMSNDAAILREWLSYRSPATLAANIRAKPL